MVRRRASWPLIAAAAALAAGVLPVAAAAAQQRPPEANDWVLIDAVVCTVNDAVILRSEIATLTVGGVRGREMELGRPLNAEERALMELEFLRKKIHQHALAQAAKTLGIISPEHVEQLFQQELEEEEQAQVRDLGTYQKLSQELARQNRTWETYVREQRVDKLADMTRGLAYSRLQNQHNLFITPQQMRAHYRKHIDDFVHDQAARISGVTCLGPDADAVARDVIAAWKLETVTAHELMRRFQDRGVQVLFENQRTTAANPGQLRQDRVDFGLAGPFGRVSDPIPVDGAVQVWKVVDFQPARAGRFEDPEVQNEIRALLEVKVIEDLMKQTIERALRRTEPWFPPVPGRIPR
jgi:hypothetical protein